MNNKERFDLQQLDQPQERAQYQLQKKTQLDAWKAEIAVHKANIHAASVDAQLDLDKLISSLEGKLEQGKTKLSEISDANEETWESMKDSMESAWNTMKSDFSDLAAKFKK